MNCYQNMTSVEGKCATDCKSCLIDWFNGAIGGVYRDERPLSVMHFKFCWLIRRVATCNINNWLIIALSIEERAHS